MTTGEVAQSPGSPGAADPQASPERPPGGRRIVTLGGRRFVLPPIRHLLTMIGIGAAAITWVTLTVYGGNPVDAYAYWRIDPANPYVAVAEYEFRYSPVVVQALTPFLDLPFETFVAIIRLVDLAALVALAGPATLFALLLPPVAAEINAANINLPLGVAVIAAFRWPGLYAFPILVKLTAGIGVLWFALRREWRAFAIAAGTTAVILAASIIANPALWQQYAEYLLENPGEAAGWPFPYPIWVRLPIALVLLVWGARTGRRWTVPTATLIALPLVFFQSPALLLALLPTFRGGWASAERWGSPERPA